MKWEPVLAMVAVIGLGLWLVWGPGTLRGPAPRPGAMTEPVRIADERGVLEALRGPGGEFTFRLLFRDGTSSPVFTAEECRRLLGERVYAQATAERSNRLFRLFNITSWAGLAWVAIGLGGQLAFSGRMLLQWLVSERSRQSIVPEAFWWMSLVGGAMLFAYFAWRQDIVGVLGQSSGLVIYGRNIRLIHKRRRKQAAPPAPANGAPGEVV